MKIIKKIARRAAKTQFARKALEEKTDLSAFREKPSPRIITGLVILAISYLLGWPAVGFCGFLSVYYNEPLIFVVGGPSIYGFSYLLFFLGIYLAGAVYTRIFLGWAARRALEKILGPGELYSEENEKPVNEDS